MPEIDLTPEHFDRLIPLSKQLLELKPWSFVPPDTLFGIRLPGSVESAYIQVIGQAGQEFGLLVIIGEESLYRLREMRTCGGDITELRMLAVSYDLVDELPPTLRAGASGSSISLDGRRLTPAFTSHIPGRTPWFLNASEADDLIVFLLQTLQVFRRRSTENFISLDREPCSCLYRIQLMGKWIDSVETVPPDPRQRSKPTLSSALVKKLWSVPADTHGFQAEFCMMPAPYGPQDERGVFPYLLLIIHEKDGYAIHDMISPDPTLRKMEMKVPSLLLQKFCDLGLKPPLLSVPEGGKLHLLMQEMGSGSLPFPIKPIEDLEPITELIDSFWESVMSSAMDDDMLPEENESVFRVKVSLMHDKRTYRKIAIGSEQTLDDLHEAIFEAFDREEEHLYTFFFPGRPTTSKQVIMRSPAISPPMDGEFSSFGNDSDSETTTIGELGLKLKQKFYYLFDWGDEWWHELTFEGEIDFDGEDEDLPAIIVRKGDSPPQYPDWDEYDDED